MMRCDLSIILILGMLLIFIFLVLIIPGVFLIFVVISGIMCAFLKIHME